MKHLLFTSLIATIMALGCKEEEKLAPTKKEPVLDIRFGHIQSLNHLNFISFPGPAISHDSLAVHKYFGISVSESYLPKDTKTDSLVIQYKARTRNDVENIDSRNGYFGIGVYAYRASTLKIGCDYYIPFKFSSKAVHNNDTFEFDGGTDFMTVDYQSRHSHLKGRDSLSIMP